MSHLLWPVANFWHRYFHEQCSFLPTRQVTCKDNWLLIRHLNNCTILLHWLSNFAPYCVFVSADRLSYQKVESRRELFAYVKFPAHWHRSPSLQVKVKGPELDKLLHHYVCKAQHDLFLQLYFKPNMESEMITHRKETKHFEGAHECSWANFNLAQSDFNLL